MTVVSSLRSTAPSNAGAVSHRDDARGLFVAAALFLAVLITEAIIIALAAPTISDIGWLPATVT
jgi:hypothetical protein